MGEILNLLDIFNDAMNYDDYINIMSEYLTLHQLHYKKFVIDDHSKNKIQKYPKLNILCITEAWCGDSLAMLPIIRKIAEVNGKWEIKLLLRDKNPNIIDQFLTNGARAIPVFIFLNEDGIFLFHWGPRPLASAEIFEKHRPLIKSGEIDKKDVIKKIRAYYAKDRGRTTLAELLEVFDSQI